MCLLLSSPFSSLSMSRSIPLHDHDPAQGFFLLKEIFFPEILACWDSDPGILERANCDCIRCFINKEYKLRHQSISGSQSQRKTHSLVVRKRTKGNVKTPIKSKMCVHFYTDVLPWAHYSSIFSVTRTQI